jgi:DNA-binding IclR family transcriptional regulator
MLSSVSNALRVLEYLVHEGEAGVSEMGRELDLTVGTVFRLTSTLVESGFAVQNPENRKYRPDAKLLTLARIMRSRVEAREVVHDLLVDLMETTRETVNLGAMVDHEIVYVDKVASNETVTIEVRAGSRVPAYCTAMGKVLLAHLDGPALDAYVSRFDELAADNPQRLPDEAEFRLELKKIAEEGYGVDAGEYSPEIYCIAAPVFDLRDTAVAAVSVSGPRSRVEPKRDQLLAGVRGAAEQLSLALHGYDDIALLL